MRFSVLFGIVVLPVIALAAPQNSSNNDDCVTQCTILGEAANEYNSSIHRCSVDTSPSGEAPCPCQPDGLLPTIASCLKHCPDSAAKTDLENSCDSQSGDSSSKSWNGPASSAGLFIGSAGVILAGFLLM
ncbi:hypothetical protein EXIGLDRAFT_832982 [Exidia glandulosa HHB12029]|uniref:Extracellular membrane protein CFEM domain-containing protein n=1 Tax=Exidia glandulosa HHB12029 TaxID=1314781 RepID=A0A165L2Y8_EXIGL|nr:hypothetical protein EXIGLDRAFT_832982 [Exidia glandulosa HHB12029]